jgi:hypothetical protein
LNSKNKYQQRLFRKKAMALLLKQPFQFYPFVFLSLCIYRFNFFVRGSDALAKNADQTGSVTLPS